MSQADFALNPLADSPTQEALQIPVEDYMSTLNLINDALNQVKGKPAGTEGVFPDYYDDLLRELIDAVPME